MSAEQLSREEVLAFLSGRPGTPEDLEPLSGGWWSSAWAYRAGGEEPEACPERRDLIHGDLLHGNVLVSPDARWVEAVFSWKCSVRGDFLFDAAWCSFWAP